MTKLINEIDKNLKIINDCNETIEITINLKDKYISSVFDKIKRLTYEECIILLDPLNTNMPIYIYDAILDRLRNLWKEGKSCNH